MTTDLNKPEARPLWRAMPRGWTGRCPGCGKGTLFRGYVKVNDACPTCARELHHRRADDAPPYFVIVVVGNVVVPLALAFALWFLPRVKGVIVDLQWACRMHGFGPDPENSSR